jgi:hypothetical protein
MLSLDVVPPPPLPVKLLAFDTAPLPTKLELFPE